MENNWKDYLAFTKKERTGIYILITLIGIGALLPAFFSTPAPSEKLIAEAFDVQKTQLEKEKQEPHPRSFYKEKQSTYHQVYDEPQHTTAFEVFPFDPNTLNGEGWKKLGLNDRTIHTIQNYVAKGGRFRSAGDLQKIYGLKKEAYDRLLPYVHIAAPAPSTTFNNNGKPRVKYVKPPPPVIDINLADTTAFISLPGIGSRLASRIVNFRDKLGGFYSVQQVGETFGLPDSTFQLIKPRLQYTPVAIKKININTADAGTLKVHPYIRWNIANAIVQYRQQHGAFHSPEELLQIVLITPELFQKILPYLTVQSE
jgi:DNA uptake protein ComE-like DNA-binding protein